MNSSPPPPANSQFQRDTSEFVVLLGDTDGSAPTPAREVHYLIPLRVTQTAGGNRIDALTFRYDLKKANKRLVDSSVPVGYNRQIELRRLDEDGDPTLV